MSEGKFIHEHRICRCEKDVAIATDTQCFVQCYQAFTAEVGDGETLCPYCREHCVEQPGE